MNNNVIELLLIEDNPGDARLIQESLKDTPSSKTFHLIWVDQFAKGLEHLSSHPVDAVLLDLTLPDSNGIDTFLNLHARVAHVPIILMTGLDDENLASRVVREGAQDYLVKGQTDSQLLERSIRYAIERKQAEDEIRRRLADLQVLYDSSLTFSNSSTPQEIGQKIIEILKQNMNWHYAIVRLKQESNDELEVIGFDAPGINYENYATEIDRLNSLIQHVGQGISGWVIQYGQTVCSGDLSSDTRYIEAFPDIHSGLYVPMKAGNQVIGVICVESQMPNVFDKHNERLLETLSKIAADAILRSRLRHQTERQLHRLKALRSIDMAISSIFDLRLILETVLDHIFAQLNVDAADFLLFNPLTQVLEYKAGRGFHSQEFSFQERLGEGLAGQSVLERRIISESGDTMLVNIPRSRLQQITQERFVSHITVPLIIKGEVKGVLEIFHRTPLDADAEWLNFLETLAGQAVIAIDNATLFENVQRSNFELTMAYDATLEGWSKALDLRDESTGSYTQRMVDITLQMAQILEINESEQLHIRRGVLLHDIGKVGVPDAILHKSGPLTEEEWIIMRKHPQFAFDMLSPIQYLRPAMDIPYCHHEKWDGTGYPRGLIGEQIPLVARLFTVVDVYDALTSDRPYRKPWPQEKALKYIRSEAGNHFDEQMVEAFLKLFKVEF